MTPPESAPLKPCPFCGASCDVYQVNRKDWVASCAAGGCIVGGLHGATAEDAAAKWNTRAVDRVLADPATVDDMARAIHESLTRARVATRAEAHMWHAPEAIAAIAAIVALIEGPRT